MSLKPTTLLPALRLDWAAKTRDRSAHLRRLTRRTRPMRSLDDTVHSPARRWPAPPRALRLRTSSLALGRPRSRFSPAA